MAPFPETASNVHKKYWEDIKEHMRSTSDNTKSIWDYHYTEHKRSLPNDNNRSFLHWVKRKTKPWDTDHWIKIFKICSWVWVRLTTQRHTTPPSHLWCWADVTKTEWVLESFFSSYVSILCVCVCVCWAQFPQRHQAFCVYSLFLIYEPIGGAHHLKMMTVVDKFWQIWCSKNHTGHVKQNQVENTKLLKSKTQRQNGKSLPWVEKHAPASLSLQRYRRGSQHRVSLLLMVSDMYCTKMQFKLYVQGDCFLQRRSETVVKDRLGGRWGTMFCSVFSELHAQKQAAEKCIIDFMLHRFLHRGCGQTRTGEGNFTSSTVWAGLCS